MRCFPPRIKRPVEHRRRTRGDRPRRRTEARPDLSLKRQILNLAIGLILTLCGWGTSGTACANDVVSDDDPQRRPISFRNDVMAVISKAGCNMGTCHGNQNGKGGFRLSLRGEDPEGDFAVLTRSLSARRVNVLDPDASLLLLKPTMNIPHEGGRRFHADSPEYAILRRWIEVGLPNDSSEVPRLVELDVSPREKILADPADSVQLYAEAVFSDGSRRDVTRLAVFETDNQLVDVTVDGTVQRGGFGETTVTVRYLNRQVPVRLAFIPARPDFTWSGPSPANYVDEQVFAKLKSLKINPSEVCDDTTFLRRASLDLLGLIPSAEEAKRFAENPDPEKRSKLIDDFLSRQEFADFWALQWSDLLRNEEKTLDRKGVRSFYAWIRDSIAHGKPMDQFVRELISARGSTYTNPPANYYRALREPFDRSESTAQLFLGIRLQCAKCHNHPFDRWTQDDYYSWANLFARVDYKIIENRRRDRNDGHEFDGEQVVYMKSSGEVNNARTGQPIAPKFLAERDAAVQPHEDRLEQLAAWLTSAENDRFAQTLVNRVWYQLMGRGIVDPIDDFRATNPPSNPALLQALSNDFVENRFDLKHLIRTIMNSKTYQLSAEPHETNQEDEINFSRAVVRRLTAEQLLDSLAQATEVPIEFNGYPAGMRAGELPGVRAIRPRDRRPSSGDQFLTLFGKPPRLQSCECERTNEATLGQAFQLISGPFVNELLTKPENRLARLAESSLPAAALVEELYWSTLSRAPSEAERTATVQFLESTDDHRQALEDLAWALLTSNEFMFRR